MLESLLVRNYALIQELEVPFNGGLNMITGETGAGKSILLGALSLILGNRADTSVLRDHREKCLVEGIFLSDDTTLKNLFDQHDLDYDASIILRREVTPQGKSRAFVNDTPVNLSVLREIGSRLVDIHSQHQNLLLNDPGYALHVLDSFARIKPLVGDYQAHFREYRKLENEITQISAELSKARADQDYLQFQFDQLDQARLVEGELEPILEEQEKLEHINEIQSRLAMAVSVLHDADEAIISRLKLLTSEIEAIAGFYREVQQPLDRLQATSIELDDIRQDISYLLDRLEPNPERLNQLSERIDLIFSLQKKHQVETVTDLIRLQEEFQTRLDRIVTTDDRLTGLVATKKRESDWLISWAGKLTKARKEVVRDFESQVTALLHGLGMPHGRFEIRIETRETFGPDGSDEVRFFFTANKNQPPEEISKVASGGEISRLMLAIKYLISDSLDIPTVIFDEIDSGVSGEIADKLGTQIAKIAQGRQVLNITHLPQVASKGDHHYLVYKYDDDKSSNTGMRLLNEQERVIELAKMLSGENLTDEAIQNARVLLEASHGTQPRS
jgi:DNA repair protein RecN (Recombination protein N)